MVHTIKLSGYKASPGALQFGTVGSYGIEQMQFVLGDDWKDFAIIATFTNPQKKSIDVHVPADTLRIDVPPEATAGESGAGQIAVVGYAASVQVISTKILYGLDEHAPIEGSAPTKPTPSVVQQILMEAQNANKTSADAKKLATDAKDIAQSVRTDADEGKFNGAKGEKGETGTTPQLKIGEDNLWHVSYDNGETWVSLGVKATGDTGAAGKDGVDGLTPHIGENGNWWIGNTDTGVLAKGIKGDTGAKGADGVSPTATVTQTDDGAEFTVTDASGTTTAVVKNGVDGKNGTPGANGISPTVQVETIDGGHRVTFTDVSDSHAVDVLDGKPGKDGVQIDDEAVREDAPWSSKHIVDMLCPKIEESGNPVACYPVAGYPLGVKAKWEPMQEGTGTPSPENIRPIKGRDSVRVERCGENLFDIGKVAETNLLTKTDRQITLKTGRVHNYDLFVSTVGLTTDVSVDYLYRLPFFPKGTYKISYNTTLPGASLSIVAVAKDGSITVISTNSQAYFTLSYGTLISIRCGPIEEVTFSNIQITIGSTAPTTYTPYIGQTNTLTLPETVYGGEVDAVSGDVKETWKTLTLDGTENWIKWESSNTALFANAFGSRRSLDLKAICSHIMTTKSIVPWVDLVNRMQVVDNAIGVNIAGKTEDVETWKSYLAAQYAAGTPVQICYVPAKHVPFTATGAQPLPALAGVNTVLTDADSATVTGRADPIKRITDLEDATASQT